jgi:hypothetical protein
MKTLIICITLLLGISHMAVGQMEFEKLEHDFGTIQEGVMATHFFKFKNAGKETDNLTSVQASCGCTTPKYTRSPLAVNDTGSIQVTYNSTGRPGPFSKAITVRSEKIEKPIILTIKGTVNPAPTPPATTTPAVGAPAQPGQAAPAAQPSHHHHHDGHKHDGHGHDHQHGPNPGSFTPADFQLSHYADTIGAIAFNQIFLYVGQLQSDTDKELVFQIKNVSKQAVTFSDKFESKPCFQISPKDKKLQPGQESIISVKFIAARSVESKLSPSMNEKIVLFTDEAAQVNRKELFINAVFKHIRTPEEIANGPKISFENTTFEAGDIIAGEEITYSFRFHNKGKSDLIIESAKASCGCTASAPKEKVIKPGSNSEIVAKFNSKGRLGQQHKTITVISNDPEMPSITLNVKCNVTNDPFGNTGGAPVNGEEGGGNMMGGGGH